MPKKLYRARKGQMVGGVCAGLAQYFGWDVSIIRIVTFIAIFMGGASFWLYVLAWVLIPLEPVEGPVPVQIIEDDESPRASAEPVKKSETVKATIKKDDSNGPEW